ncbi:MAG: galactokinase [Polyangiales bacterium]
MTPGHRYGPHAFEARFGVAPGVVVQAPGRVNLLGEHTDYNGGFVLPTVIPQRTGVEAARAPDREALVVSEDVGPPARYTLGDERPAGTWGDYAKGLTWALAREGFRVGGFVARVTSSVPVGAGLSSSAALLVAFGRALRALFDLPLDDLALALVAHRAEHDFVGVPVGVMDPVAVSLAATHTALFLDTRAMRFERLPLPPSVELVVADSGVTHRHATGDYRARRDECARAARMLGLRELRDAPPDWGRAAASLPPPLGRRVRHVVTENARVLDAVDALRVGDVAHFGALMNDGHRSMRDDYEASHPAVDRLVERAQAHPGTLGARITGGGFGGSVVALVRAGAAEDVAASVLREAERDGRRGVRVLVPAGWP